MNTTERVTTNLLLMKAIDFNRLMSGNLTANEIHYLNHMESMINETLSQFNLWINSREAQKYFYENIRLAHDAFDSIDEELDEIVKDTSLSANQIVEKIYEKALSKGYNELGVRHIINDASRNALKFLQTYNFNLIRNVNQDLRDTIKHQIFRGIAEGSTPQRVAKAIKEAGVQPLEGKTLSAYQRSLLIARTETARAMTTGSLQSYENYGVKEIEVLTAGDDLVCKICRENEANNPHKIEDANGLVPAHPNCRCAVMPVIPDKLEPKENPDTINLTGESEKKLAYDDLETP